MVFDATIIYKINILISKQPRAQLSILHFISYFYSGPKWNHVYSLKL